MFKIIKTILAKPGGLSTVLKPIKARLAKGFSIRIKNCYVFQPWFAWHPVAVCSNHFYTRFAFLRIVQRRKNGSMWVYKEV